MSHASDAAMQRYFRESFGLGRELTRVGPFLASFDASSDSPYLSYAIPDDGATPNHADVDALVAHYVGKKRKPRLEYLPSVSPAVEAALVECGFSVEACPPLMTATAESVPKPSVPADFELAAPQGREELVKLSQVLAQAFGVPAEGGLDAGWMEGQLAAGAHVLLARVRASGEIVGGGTALAPKEGVTEIAGIGVLAGHRGKGLAGAITTTLSHRAFAAGVTLALISPGTEEAGRVYLRAGFAIRSALLHISR